MVDALCDELGIECPVVVGNSMGGFVGAELALSFPTRVERLVLVAAAGLTTEYCRREPAAHPRPPVGASARLGAAARAHVVVTRPRLRRAALQFVVRYPEKLSPAAGLRAGPGHRASPASSPPWAR